MSNPALKTHLIIGGLWLALAFALMIKITMLGNEEQGLAKSRGNDLKARTDMAFQVDRLRSQLDVEASAPALDQAIRNLGMPLQPPLKVADVRFATGPRD
jgi:hypothetical protein